MALSSANRNALSEAVVWLSCAVIFGLSLFYMKDIRDLMLGTVAERQAIATTTQQANEEPARNYISAGVELRADRRGHFSADAEINGRPASVLVDTGATMVALTYEDARDAGIYPSNSDYTMRASTANGVTKFAPVTLGTVSIGGITVRNVRAAVAQPGRLQQTLLGMSFLGRLSRVDMRSGRLILEE